MTEERTVTLSIADQFSRFPAGRFLTDGEFSGTRFRTEYLTPALKGLGETQRLKVTFDGVAGLGSSFLEEAFGGLVRDERLEKAFLDAHLIITTDEEDLKDFVGLAWKYIERAANAPA